ncbi:unnamed protein product [Sphagnum jensenii]|uniref:LAGLIDADG homing endonuclease n=1 Tax=Sphagnum jensenii TaxID=128206 RepID=A0ABP1C1Z3_9BRYO
MGFKTNNSPIDAWLSKMEVAINNIVSLAATSNLVVNQLMEHEAVAIITTKDVSTKEPKWITVIAKNMCQVVSRAMETLTDTPKQKEHKLNLRLMGFEAKEGKTKKELMQRLNTRPNEAVHQGYHCHVTTTYN